MTEKRRLTSLQELLAWFETKHYRFKDNLLLFFYFSEVCVNLLHCHPGKKEVACLWNDKHKYLLLLIQLLFSRWLQLVYFFSHSFQGFITPLQWANTMEKTVGLAIPWHTLRSRLVSSNADNTLVNYESCLDRDLVYQGDGVDLSEDSPGITETLYRNRSALETIFRIIDKDHSGRDRLISIFHRFSRKGAVVIEAHIRLWNDRWLRGLSAEGR